MPGIDDKGALQPALTATDDSAASSAIRLPSARPPSSCAHRRADPDIVKKEGGMTLAQLAGFSLPKKDLGDLLDDPYLLIE
jgi:hypothetical protein